MAHSHASHAAHDGHDHHGHAHHEDDGFVHAHVSPALFYWAIFGGLIVLTFITVGVSYVDLGSANTIVAVIVATMKASLVAAFFMHLAHDKLFNTVCLLASFAFLILFFTMTYEDVGTRAKMDETYGAAVLPGSGEVAPGGMTTELLKHVETAGKTVSEGHGKEHGAAGTHTTGEPKAGEHKAGEPKPAEGHEPPKAPAH